MRKAYMNYIDLADMIGGCAVETVDYRAGSLQDNELIVATNPHGVEFLIMATERYLNPWSSDLFVQIAVTERDKKCLFKRWEAFITDYDIEYPEAVEA